jgi:hypothetical protein
MSKLLPLLLLSSFWLGVSWGQTSQQPAAGGPAMAPRSQASQFAPGTKLRAELEKTIDAKKAKPGDPVLAKTMDELESEGAVVAPRGSKIVGHVVAVSPHEEDSPSRLEIAFDKLVLEHGAEVAMKATVQALAKPVVSAPIATDDTSPGPSGVPPMGPANRSSMPQVPGGTGQSAGAANAGTMGNPTGASGAPTPQSSKISLNAEGVLGMPELTLAAGSAQDSVLSSEKHNVKLESGTQMILEVE